MTAVHDICQKLPEQLCAILPAFHALTGRDSVSAFYGYGKKKAWKASQSRQGSGDVENLTSLRENNIQRAIPVARKLVSLMYDPQDKHRLAHNNLNQLREKIASVKNVLVHKLPPSEPAFLEHVKRAAFQCRIWMLAGEPKPDIHYPDANGWNRQAGILHPTYFEGPTAAEMLNELVCSCRGSKPCINNCTCMKNGLTCTEECMCAQGERECGNELTENDDDEEPMYF